MEALETMTDRARYEALLARDARFDGLFFVGVRTTGIYCRPVCTARTPRRSSCVFFASAVAAEGDGFRACFVCRPELAPRATFAGRTRMAADALEAIDDGALDEGTLAELAARVGTTSRTLRRAFDAEVGATPHAIASSRRLALAKRLLHDSRLPMIDVAYASGFGSLRRFNAAFVASFGVPPSRLRRQREDGEEPTFPIRLDVRPPHRPERTFAFFAAREIPAIERATPTEYTRGLAVDGVTGAFRARAGKRGGIVADVTTSLAPRAGKVARVLRRVFDTDARPDPIDAHLAADPVLGPLVAEAPGLRVPGTPEPFEAAVRAVVGQRISVKAARTIVARLVDALGAKMPATCFGIGRLFPAPAAVVAAGPARLRALGLPLARAEALHAVAALAASGGLAGASPEVRARLLAIRGIGPFTAGYVAMRGLSDPDALPEGDLVVARAFGVAPGALARRMESLRPFRAYATLHVYSAALRGDPTS